MSNKEEGKINGEGDWGDWGEGVGGEVVDWLIVINYVYVKSN